MMRYTLVALVTVAGGATVAWSGQVSGTIDAQFGDEIERVRSTFQRDDDVQLAQRMLEHVRDASLSGRALREACQTIYELGSAHRDGYAAAVGAMRLLAERFPDRRVDALTRAASRQRDRYQRAEQPAQRNERGQTLVELYVSLAEAMQEDGRSEPAVWFYEEAAAIAGEIQSDRLRQITRDLHDLKIKQQIRELEQRLEDDPTDHEAADELMRLYVVELDDPEKAREYWFTADDESMKDHVDTAARGPESTFVSEEALAMGNWYRSLMAEASSMAKPRMADRAVSYYRRFLELHRADDAAAQQVRGAIQQLEGASTTAVASAAPVSVDTASASSPPAGNGSGVSGNTNANANADRPYPEGARVSVSQRPDQPTTDPGNTAPAAAPDQTATEDGWVNLLQPDVVDTAQLGLRGSWQFEGDQLVGGPPTPAQLTLPFVPPETSHYIVEVEFQRTTPIGSVAVHLPVGGRQVLAKFGDRRRRQRDHIAGLAVINGNPAHDNDTTTPFALETDKTYTARIEVDTSPNRTSITAAVDGEQLIDWSGLTSDLAVVDAWGRLKPQALGLGTDGGGQALFSAARLKMIDGQIQLPQRITPRPKPRG